MGMNNRLHLNNLTHNQAWLLQGGNEEEKEQFYPFLLRVVHNVTEKK